MRDIFEMVGTHCAVCKNTISCGDMGKCPLALAKWRGVYISPEEFARSLGKAPVAPYTPSTALPKGPSGPSGKPTQMSLF